MKKELKAIKAEIKNNMVLSYKEALDKCLEVHNQRRKKYGDSWRESKEYQLMGLVKEKCNRLEYNFLHPSNDYENKIDCLIDLVNWSLFYLQKEIENAGIKTTSNTSSGNFTGPARIILEDARRENTNSYIISLLSNGFSTSNLPKESGKKLGNRNRKVEKRKH